MPDLIRDKWYEVGSAAPPIGEYVVVAVTLGRYRTFIKALYVGGMHFVGEDLCTIDPPTHFMMLSEPAMEPKEAK